MIVGTRTRCVVEVALVLLVSGSVISPAAAQSRRAMTVDDVLDLVQVSAPRISPDGRRVVYTLSELAQALKDRGVPARFIRFPREPTGSASRTICAFATRKKLRG